VKKSTQSLLRNFATAPKTFALPRPKTCTSLYGKVVWTRLPAILLDGPATQAELSQQPPCTWGSVDPIRRPSPLCPWTSQSVPLFDVVPDPSVRPARVLGVLSTLVRISRQYWSNQATPRLKLHMLFPLSYSIPSPVASHLASAAPNLNTPTFGTATSSPTRT